MGTSKEEYAICEHYANLMSLDTDYVIHIIESVQELIDMGMWFSDACEVVCIVTKFSDKLNNQIPVETSAQFWDFISECCWTKTAPLTQTTLW